EEPTFISSDFEERAIEYFKTLLSSVLKMPASRIEANAPFEKYGIDSILVMQLTNQLEKTFGSLPKTLFFEYQNLRELTGYFLDAHRVLLQQLLGIGEQERVSESASVASASTPEPSAVSSRRRSRLAASSTAVHAAPVAQPAKAAKGEQDIAIIGVSGRYPGARNLQEFWGNLRDGEDSITEIPQERWDHSLYFDPDKSKAGKTNSKWGGFIDGVDQFDPKFFNISPREAEIMDPQERLFLQTVYEALEDAGYTREMLAKHRGLGLDGNVGVYVGVMYEEYQLYGAEETILGRPLALSGNPSSIANRVSYFFNLHGPSLAVDTMCSSSLTSIHLACQSLQQGGCELAIAGGVNVSIH
ncbi:acyl carrier protein, partial [Paenibacillus maysiensis]|uniref:acyl carrier protein n=1 Tax=Paenibacillus maysiensis TaxID=1155954 RepID=UPI001FD80D4B